MKTISKLGLGAMLFSSVFSIASTSLVQRTSAHTQETKETTQAKGYRNVMYYGDWSVWGGQDNFHPSGIAEENLTHLNFAFLDFDSNGNLQFTDPQAATELEVGMPGTNKKISAGLLNAFQDLRAKNPNLKIGVSLGGWSKSGDFSVVAADPAKRKNFVENIAKFIKYTNMDFVDVDWEYPADVREPDLIDNKNDEGTPHAMPEDKENYIILLNEIREAIDKQGEELGKEYELSVALPASRGRLDSGIDIPKLFDIVDFANIMTYDLTGAWASQSGHHSGLYGNPADPNYDEGLSVDQAVSYLRDQGASSEKIVIGAAFYSRGWNQVAKGDNPALPGLFQKAEQNNQDADGTPSYGAPNSIKLTAGDQGRASGVWAFREHDKLKEKFPGLKEYWDDTAKAPYMYSESTGEFFTYDNERSIGYKTEYVKEQDLGGVISWMQSQDRPSTGTTRDTLTKAINKGLFGNEKLPEHTIVSPDLAISADVNTYSQAGSTGYEITIRNNERADEFDAVLSRVERAQETIKFPKLYIPVNASETLTAGNANAGRVTTSGGHVVVDLSDVEAAHDITQGRSYTFRLRTNAAQADVSRIQNVNLVQRIGTSGADLYPTVIYEADTKPDPSDKEAPSVPTNLQATLVEGTKVTVNWTRSTDNVQVAGYYVYRNGQRVGQTTSNTFTDTNLNTNTRYTYTVEAFDASGNVSAASAPLVVTTLNEDTPPAYEAWDPNKAYWAGDMVTYQGKNYRAKWWTQGNIPGTEQWGPWELIS
ncbi:MULTISPECIES: glycosyl hydrolase family 18 protein [unclassified Enterococcus]|uniref:glycosyl hydrolase family 18 protein n=1 Tax=unclassified Enterococcus TaxID=2608891 RepID=UPI0013EA48A1|nr:MULTISPECIES: glycosyl hydrolase family 18 protein [unclassified Enterococcus]